MDQAVLEQLDGHAPDGAAELPDQRAGRHRCQNTGGHHRLQHARVAVDRRAALRVGEQDAVSLALELAGDLEQPARDRREGRLEQQPRPAAEPQRPQLSRVDVLDLGHRDLGAGVQHERDLVRRELASQLRDVCGDRLGVLG